MISLKVREAFLPGKHVRFCDSLVGLAGFILQHLGVPCTIDEIFSIVKKDKSWPGVVSFASVLLAVDILYALKQVEIIVGDRIAKRASL